LFAVLLCLAGGPAAAQKRVEANVAQTEIPWDQLLDVGIQIFDPGLPDLDELAMVEKGIFPDLRRSEAKFIAVQLRRTLESTGHWGAVTVLPTTSEGVDVNVSGEILQSTGMTLAVRVQVVDSLGRVWKDKRYKQDADQRAYLDDEQVAEKEDPYQSLYNKIANDMLAERESLKPKQLKQIREIAAVKFAADIAPDIFGGYLSMNKKGRYKIRRLPAEGDPMMDRIDRIRERDYAFVDTLNEHYANFHDQMAESYDEFRMHSWHEERTLRAVRREARMEKILGGLLLVGAAVTGGSTRTARAARTASVVGGGMVLAEGIERGKEAKIHVESLKELAQSFDAEIEPMLVEVEGRVLRLEGSAEAQYAEWRKLLHEIFREEVSLPTDPNAGASTADARTATD
jgi:hypothetical protein